VVDSPQEPFLPEARNAVATAPTRSAAPAVNLRFWGTRGSIPSPGPATAGYGGNTPCIEVEAGGRRYIFDAGSGIRPLGIALIEDAAPLDAVIFLTHFHWDHIQGFPFFGPMYRPDARLHVVGPMQQNLDVQSLFAGQMGPIYFPVPFEAVSATMTFEHLNEGTWSADGVTVSAMRVRHPSFTVGYRMDSGGRSICYVPDNELVGGGHETAKGWRERFLDFCRGTDVLIHDAMFTDEEHGTRMGWGHSTFQQTLDLAAEAGVKRLLFFHHAPERTDDELVEIVDQRREEAATRGLRLEVDAAAEGNEIALQ
jgi:phosphoribosyl 1,2-cyclic phosphodiesterase